MSNAAICMSNLHVLVVVVCDSVFVALSLLSSLWINFIQTLYQSLASFVLHPQARFGSCSQ